MQELKATAEAIEKRESERRALEEKKHAEEVQFLKRTNAQLKKELETYLSLTRKSASVCLLVRRNTRDRVYLSSAISVSEQSELPCISTPPRRAHSSTSRRGEDSMAAPAIAPRPAAPVRDRAVTEPTSSWRPPRPSQVPRRRVDVSATTARRRP